MGLGVEFAVLGVEVLVVKDKLVYALGVEEALVLELLGKGKGLGGGGLGDGMVGVVGVLLRWQVLLIMGWLGW